MKDRTVWVVTGLWYGDEGKGSVVDYLARATGASHVVRHNGGHQAAHHVVLRDGRWHCFSQFGSGTLVPRVRTHLGPEMLWKPQNLLAERDVLKERGVLDALPRLTIHPDAYVVTPWHAMLGRMLETARSTRRHGSVGKGVGQAALARERDWPGGILARDLFSPAQLETKVRAHWAESADRAQAILREHGTAEVRQVFEHYAGVTPKALLDTYANCAAELEGRLADSPTALAQGSSAVILEGAQGVLLDRTYGFQPYVTKTDTTFRSADRFLQQAGVGQGQVVRVGVLRAYATRHGAGPFVTGSTRLTAELAESHNGTNPWQGEFRVGHFDLVAARYACAVCGGLDCLAVTNLDRLVSGTSVAVCTAYLYGGEVTDELDEFFIWERDGKGARIDALKPLTHPSIERQTRLAGLLTECRPACYRLFKPWPPFGPGSAPHTLSAEVEQFLSFLESQSGLGIPIGLISFGPTDQEKQLIALKL